MILHCRRTSSKVSRLIVIAVFNKKCILFPLIDFIDNLTIYSYKEAVQTALKVAKQISSVVFFAVVFQFCYTKNIFIICSHLFLFWFGLVFVFCFFVFCIWDRVTIFRFENFLYILKNSYNFSSLDFPYLSPSITCCSSMEFFSSMVSWSENGATNFLRVRKNIFSYLIVSNL